MVIFKLKDAKNKKPYLAWAGFPARWTADPLQALTVTKERAARLKKEWVWLAANAEVITVAREG